MATAADAHVPLAPQGRRVRSARPWAVRRRWVSTTGLFVAWALAIAPVSVAATGRTEAPSTGVEVEAIAAMAISELPAPPLFVGLAHVIVPPGVRSSTAGTAGPRLLAIDAGTLTVAVAGPAEVSRALGVGTGATGPPVALVSGEEVVLGPGDRLALATGGIRDVRNDGARPTVYLDAALFPPGAEPVTAAFTTPDGVSFQLLAGGVVEAVPAGPAEFGVRRLRLAPGAALPEEPRAGPAVAYVESGSLDLVPTAGEVLFGRAAAPAPSSAAGPLRKVPLGRTAALTAGAAVSLAAGSAVSSHNERAVPAVVLVVEVLPAGSTAAE